MNRRPGWQRPTTPSASAASPTKLNNLKGQSIKNLKGQSIKNLAPPFLCFKTELS
jgi:hypothetical protein